MRRNSDEATKRRSDGGNSTARSASPSSLRRSVAPSLSFRLNTLRQSIRPFRLHWYPRLRSTNDHAARMRKRGELFAPAVVLAGRQIAGRGRGANTWWSDTGSLTATFIFAAGDELSPHQLPLIAGLAVRNALAQLTGDGSIQLKWPNDVVYGGRKLAGLLCERVRNADLIGLGINVNMQPTDPPAALRPLVASLSQIMRHALDINEVLATVARTLHATVSRRHAQPFSQMLREYDRHHALLGRRVSVLSNGQGLVSGRCLGLDSMGRLLLRDRRTVHHVIAGQVQA